jgi:hypothetical protein
MAGDMMPELTQETPTAPPADAENAGALLAKRLRENGCHEDGVAIQLTRELIRTLARTRQVAAEHYSYALAQHNACKDACARLDAADAKIRRLTELCCDAADLLDAVCEYSTVRRFLNGRVWDAMQDVLARLDEIREVVAAEELG